jgi:hypothetical protein
VKRHITFSLRQPELISILLVHGFNEECVHNLFDILEKVIDENTSRHCPAEKEERTLLLNFLFFIMLFACCARVRNICASEDNFEAIEK